MLYKGEFRNIEDELIIVEMITGNDTTSTKNLTLVYDEPVVITQNSGSLFDPIKPLSCTIRCLNKEFLPDLYSTDYKGVKVTVKNSTQDKVLFYGYLTPCIYTQGWDYIDELEFEAVSSLSVLENVEYEISDNNIQNWRSIIDKCLSETGFYTEYYFTYNGYLKREDSAYQYKILDNCYQNELNFIDDDKEATVWSCKEILSEFCKAFGITLLEFEGKLYFVDYEDIKTQRKTPTNMGLYKYVIGTTTTPDFMSILYTKNITKNDYRSGGNSLSLEDLHSRININANLYPQEAKVFDLFNDADLELVHPETYIEFSSSTDYNDEGIQYSKYYSDFDKKIHITVYRFYRNKNFNFYAVPVTYNSSNKTWTKGTRIEQPTRFANKTALIEFIRTHICCFIVKE